MPAPRVNPQESSTDGWDDGVVYDGVPITVATELLQIGRKKCDKRFTAATVAITSRTIKLFQGHLLTTK